MILWSFFPCPAEEGECQNGVLKTQRQAKVNPPQLGSLDISSSLKKLHLFLFVGEQNSDHDLLGTFYLFTFPWGSWEGLVKLAQSVAVLTVSSPKRQETGYVLTLIKFYIPYMAILISGF